MKANGRSESLRFSARLKWTRPTSRQRLSWAREKGLDREAACRELVIERMLEGAPERGETCRVQIFAPAHRRRLVDDRIEVVLGGLRDARRSAPGRLSAGADRRDEARCEGSPKSEFRREAASRFRGAELQQAVSAPAREGGFEPAGDSVIDPGIRRQKFETQRAVGRQNRNRRFGHRLDLARARSCPLPGAAVE